jgi:hypothetical protein
MTLMRKILTRFFVICAAVAAPLFTVSAANAATVGQIDPGNHTLLNVQVHDAATGYCLDSGSNGDVYTLPCNGGPYQHWNMYHAVWNGTDTFDFQNVATHRCLWTDGWHIQTVSCTPSDPPAIRFAIVFDQDYVDSNQVYFFTGQFTDNCLDSNSSKAHSNLTHVGSVYMSAMSTGTCQGNTNLYQTWNFYQD